MSAAPWGVVVFRRNGVRAAVVTSADGRWGRVYRAASGRWTGEVPLNPRDVVARSPHETSLGLAMGSAVTLLAWYKKDAKANKAWGVPDRGEVRPFANANSRADERNRENGKCER